MDYIKELLIPYKSKIILLIVLSIIYYLVFMISMWKIFEKEKKKPWLSLIPIINFYIYYKILKVPFILFFIPVVNQITLLLMPYRLAKRYYLNKWLRWLSVICPYIMLPYIGFSKRHRPVDYYSHVYVKNNEEVDALDKKLAEDTIEEENLYLDKKGIKAKAKKIKKSTDFIDELNSDEIADKNFEEIIYEDPTNSSKVEIKEENKELEHDKEIEEFIDQDIIDQLDQKGQDNTNEKDIQTNKKDVVVEHKDETIAFGGKELVDKYSSKTKNDKLKCPRCGSSLIGAKGTCPGCGLQLEE